LVGEWIDASIILVVIFLNAILGTVQESKAEAALDALEKMAAPTALDFQFQKAHFCSP
jgi:Ca2+-transporting ATPase